MLNENSKIIGDNIDNTGSLKNEEQINKILIEKRELVDDSFTIYKEIADYNQLKEINGFLDNIQWEQVEIDITLPDYKVTVNNKDVYKIGKISMQIYI